MIVNHNHHDTYFFHVTDDYKGDQWFMKPRRIKSSESEYHHINRICVAPTFEQCVIALINFNSDSNWYIYRTKEKISQSSKPSEHIVMDANLTDERWLLEPTEMVIVGEMFALNPSEKMLEDYINSHYVSPDVAITFDNCNFISMDYNDRGDNFGINRQTNTLETIRALLDKDIHPFYDNKNFQLNSNQRNVQIK